jgi:hypothetical protein
MSASRRNAVWPFSPSLLALFLLGGAVLMILAVALIYSRRTIYQIDAADSHEPCTLLFNVITSRLMPAADLVALADR